MANINLILKTGSDQDVNPKKTYVGGGADFTTTTDKTVSHSTADANPVRLRSRVRFLLRDLTFVGPADKRGGKVKIRLYDKKVAGNLIKEVTGLVKTLPQPTDAQEANQAVIQLEVSLSEDAEGVRNDFDAWGDDPWSIIYSHNILPATFAEGRIEAEIDGFHGECEFEHELIDKNNAIVFSKNSGLKDGGSASSTMLFETAAV